MSATNTVELEFVEKSSKRRFVDGDSINILTQIGSLYSTGTIKANDSGLVSVEIDGEGVLYRVEYGSRNKRIGWFNEIYLKKKVKHPLCPSCNCSFNVGGEEEDEDPLGLL